MNFVIHCQTYSTSNTNNIMITWKTKIQFSTIWILNMQVNHFHLQSLTYQSIYHCYPLSYLYFRYQVPTYILTPNHAFITGTFVSVFLISNKSISLVPIASLYNCHIYIKGTCTYASFYPSIL